jgi:hypothetical protein
LPLYYQWAYALWVLFWYHAIAFFTHAFQTAKALWPTLELVVGVPLLCAFLAVKEGTWSLWCLYEFKRDTWLIPQLQRGYIAYQRECRLPLARASAQLYAYF